MDSRSRKTSRLNRRCNSELIDEQNVGSVITRREQAACAAQCAVAQQRRNVVIQDPENPVAAGGGPNQQNNGPAQADNVPGQDDNDAAHGLQDDLAAVQAGDNQPDIVIPPPPPPPLTEAELRCRVIERFERGEMVARPELQTIAMRIVDTRPVPDGEKVQAKIESRPVMQQELVMYLKREYPGNFWELPHPVVAPVPGAANDDDGGDGGNGDDPPRPAHRFGWDDSDDENDDNHRPQGGGRPQRRGSNGSVNSTPRTPRSGFKHRNSACSGSGSTPGSRKSARLSETR